MSLANKYNFKTADGSPTGLKIDSPSSTYNYYIDVNIGTVSADGDQFDPLTSLNNVISSILSSPPPPAGIIPVIHLGPGTHTLSGDINIVSQDIVIHGRPTRPAGGPSTIIGGPTVIDLDTYDLTSDKCLHLRDVVVIDDSGGVKGKVSVSGVGSELVTENVRADGANGIDVVISNGGCGNLDRSSFVKIDNSGSGTETSVFGGKAETIDNKNSAIITVIGTAIDTVNSSDNGITHINTPSSDISVVNVTNTGVGPSETCISSSRPIDTVNVFGDNTTQLSSPKVDDINIVGNGTTHDMSTKIERLGNYSAPGGGGVTCHNIERISGIVDVGHTLVMRGGTFENGSSLISRPGGLVKADGIELKVGSVVSNVPGGNIQLRAKNEVPDNANITEGSLGEITGILTDSSEKTVIRDAKGSHELAKPSNPTTTGTTLVNADGEIEFTLSDTTSESIQVVYVANEKLLLDGTRDIKLEADIISNVATNITIDASVKLALKEGTAASIDGTLVPIVLTPAAVPGDSKRITLTLGPLRKVGTTLVNKTHKISVNLNSPTGGDLTFRKDSLRFIS